MEVVPPLEQLLPLGGLRRGSVVATGGGAATSLALALAAGPSAGGSWVGVVGVPGIGLSAAAELGVRLERLFLVASPPPRQWGEVVAAAAEGAEVVLAGLPGHVRPGELRRVQARLQARGTVLVLIGPAAAASPELELTGTPIGWEGIGDGHGRLLARRVHVERSGRRAGRPAAREVWLPGPDGQLLDAGVPAQPLRPRSAG
jgi:hypothetical protein